MKKIGYKEAVRKVAARGHGDCQKAISMKGCMEEVISGLLAIDAAESRLKAGASAVAFLFDVDPRKVDKDVADELSRLMGEE